MSTPTLAGLVRGARSAVVLTGAGVSTDSGIPDFRSRLGLWAGADPMRFASYAGFLRDPEGFYEFWRAHLGTLERVRPNIAHEVVARLERRGIVRCVVTQNVDGLHQAAGSKNVIEVHGTFRTVRCVQCGVRETSARVFASRRGLPRCRVCGGMLRPDVILFGEGLGGRFEEAVTELEQADLLLVLGTSLEVAPVSELVPLAKSRGATVAIVNRDETELDELADVVLHRELAETMRTLARALDLA